MYIRIHAIPPAAPASAPSERRPAHSTYDLMCSASRVAFRRANAVRGPGETMTAWARVAHGYMCRSGAAWSLLWRAGVGGAREFRAVILSFSFLFFSSLLVFFSARFLLCSFSSVHVFFSQRPNRAGGMHGPSIPIPPGAPRSTRSMAPMAVASR
jgi:hypothetical protein